MFENDELLRRLINYNFNNLIRNDVSVSKFLEGHFKEYIDDVENGVTGKNDLLDKKIIQDVSNELNVLRELCEKIIEVISTFEAGHIKQAYDKAYELLNKHQSLLLTKKLDDQCLHVFSRIRLGNFKEKEKSELFHIPKDKNNLIGGYRYSVAGFPCLYLSNSLELCWYECNMPKKFSFCQMKIAKDEKIKLLDFTQRPMDFFSYQITNYLNYLHISKENQIKAISFQIKNYILSYPIVASCSMIVKDRGNKFVPEYIMPQILMQWIRESTDVDGVMYMSSLNNSLNKGMGAFNIALPCKLFRDDGLCESLTRKMEVSDIEYIDIIEYFNQQKKNLLDEISKLKNKVWMFMIHSKCKGGYLNQMIELCDYINITYKAILEDKYVNGELIFNFINCMDTFISFFKRNKATIIEKTIIKDGLEFEKTSEQEINTLNDLYIKFVELAETTVKRNQIFYMTSSSGLLKNFTKL